METLTTHLATTPLVYIAREIERAIGLPPTPGYFIITNASTHAKRIAEKRGDCLLIDEGKILDTHELISHPKTAEFLAAHPGAEAIVFKNTSLIERAATALGLRVLNPPAELGRTVEEKLSQLTWLGDLTALLPPHQVVPCRALRFEGKPIVVQFNHAHTGMGTTLVTEDRTLKLLQAKFPNRDVRVTDYIDGPMYTLIACVWGTTVLTSSINYQITGLAPFTDNQFATIGNDWALPPALLNDSQKNRIKKMATEIGTKLQKDGWTGLFGIDVIVDSKTGTPYLIEINARQQAGATYESTLQKTVGTSENFVTTFESHLAALLGIAHGTEEIAPVTNGAQIILRVPRTGQTKDVSVIAKKFEAEKFSVITYDNPLPGGDALRVQSATGILAGHNAFNERGEKIKSILSV